MAAGGVAVCETRFQLVAERHQSINFGGDVVEARERFTPSLQPYPREV